MSDRLRERIEARKNGGRNTQAKIIGDGVDMAIASMNSDDARQFADYPETVLDVLRLFVKIFKFPTSTIPYKSSKDFSRWVEQLNEINEICGSNVEDALILAKQRYDESDKSFFMIIQPRSIKKLLIAAAVQINSGFKVERETIVPDSPVEKIVVNKEEVKKSARRMRRLLDE